MSTRSWRPLLLLAAVWVAGAVLATSVGVLAVRQVASQVGDPAVAVLSDGAVASGSATPPAPVGTPSPVVSPTAGVRPGSPPVATPALPPRTGTAPAAPRPAPATRSGTFRSAGGTVGAQCSGQVIRLLYATPADGYALDEQSASGSELEVRFEAGETRVRLKIRCLDGTPRLVENRADGGSDDD